MRADLTRMTFDPHRHFSRVLFQQGRVQLDADFNEQVAILLHYLRALSIDLKGEHWGVGDGFRIEPVEPGDPDYPFRIHSGHYYVKGILCENDATVAYTAQPFYPNPERLSEDQDYEVYLDVWERDISAIEEPGILEVALGGPDTAARTKVVWQVKADTEETRSRIELSDARLQARASRPVKTEDPCIIPPDARYRGPENQLYRVEIHRGSEDIPTFKWSRENGSVVFPIRKREGLILTLEHLGRDERFGLHVGDWVEIVDDDYVLQGRSEPLLRVDAVDPLARRVTLHTLPASTVGEDDRKHPLLRRWDQEPDSRQADDGALLVREDEWLDLEDGVQVRFERGGTYRSGDYWMIPARTETGDIEWPRASDNPRWVRPHGIIHSFAPLASLSIGGKERRRRGP